MLTLTGGGIMLGGGMYGSPGTMACLPGNDIFQMSGRPFALSIGVCAAQQNLSIVDSIPQSIMAGLGNLLVYFAHRRNWLIALLFQLLFLL